MQVTAHLLMSPPKRNMHERAARRQRATSVPHSLFVSSAAADCKSIWSGFYEQGVVLQKSSTVRQLTLRSLFHLPATASIISIVTISTDVPEPALDTSAITIADSPTNATGWSCVATTTYGDAGRLDTGGWSFLIGPVCHSMAPEIDGNRFLVHFHQRHKVLPTILVFAYFAYYSDPLDAERLRFDFEQSVADSRIKQEDNKSGNWSRIVFYEKDTEH